MPQLIPVKYGKKNYPQHISCDIHEVAGNFDKQRIEINSQYSLHTEYSYMPRKLNSDIVSDLTHIKNAQRDGVPQLWYDEGWALEFAVFIQRLVADNRPPEVIEIHPPFNDYCSSFEQFLGIFRVFQEHISSIYPDVTILIENRCGTMYKGGKFILSTCSDILMFCEALENINANLRIVLDYPQIFSAELIKMDSVKLDKILAFNTALSKHKKHIGGFHMWGKKKSQKGNRWTPHIGNFNDFFCCDEEMKRKFLSSVYNTFEDDTQRYFVPEVNSVEDDLLSIVADMEATGFTFITRNPVTEINQLIRIKWENQQPLFELLNRNTGEITCRPALGNYTFSVSPIRYCVGSYELGTYKHIPCESNSILQTGKACKKCENINGFKSCLFCRGDKCFTSNVDVLCYCNQSHYIYLAYFPDEIIKVGTAHSLRKEDRLIEQGALYRLFIAEVPTGKLARKIEAAISQLGYKSAVTSKYKIKNLFIKKTKDEIHELLFSARSRIFDNLREQYSKHFLEEGDVLSSNQILDTLSNISNENINEMAQLTLFDIIGDSAPKYDVVTSISSITGELISFIGSICLYKDEGNNLRAFDFKALYGSDLIFG